MLSLKLFFAGNLMLAGIEVTSNQVLLGFVGSCVLIALGISLYKKHLANQRQALIQKYANNKENESAASRKYEEVSIFKHSGIANRIGGVVALLFSFLAINYTSYTKEVIYEPIVMDIPAYEGQILEPPSTPATPPPPPPAAPPPPPPPPPPTTAFKVTEEKIDEVIEIKDPEDDKVKMYDPNADPNAGGYGDGYSTGVTGGTGPAGPPAPPPPPPPPAPVAEIFEVVEQMPRFPGCEDVAGDDNAKKQCADQKMMQWIYSQIKYPAQAREMGIEGTAVVSFVVDENGNIKDAEIRRKVGGGCEEEAIRVVKEMAKLPQKWTPGKQRGRAVAVRYTLPVRFKLT